MKRSIAFILIFLLFLSACGQTNSDQNSDQNSEVVDALFNKDMALGYDQSIFMTSVPSGYVFHVSNQLYYAESENMASTLLCALPDCSHTDDSCNSVLNVYGSCVNCNGRLYYIDGLYGDGTFGLYAMSYAGDERNLVTRLDGWSVESSNSNVSFALSGDDLIYVPDGNNVYYKSLSTGENIQIYTYDGPDSYTYIYAYESDGTPLLATTPMSFYSIWDTWADEDTMYFIGTVPLNETTFVQQLYAYTPGQESAELVWTAPTSDDAGPWETADVCANGWYLNDGILYYFLSGNGLWQYDLASEETSCLFSVDFTVSGDARFDCEYVYLITGSDILIYDYAGNLIGTISLASIEAQITDFEIGSDLPECTVLGTDDDNIFLYYQGISSAAASDDPEITYAQFVLLFCYVNKQELQEETPVYFLLEI